MDNYFDIKFNLWYDHELYPNFIEEIPFYEYQIWLTKLNKKIEEESERSVAEDGKKQIFSFKNPSK